MQTTKKKRNYYFVAVGWLNCDFSFSHSSVHISFPFEALVLADRRNAFGIIYCSRLRRRFHNFARGSAGLSVCLSVMKPRYLSVMLFGALSLCAEIGCNVGMNAPLEQAFERKKKSELE